jgi:hypothetical protein
MPFVRVLVPQEYLDSQERIQRILPRITGNNYKEACNALSALGKSGVPMTFELLSTSTST